MDKEELEHDHIKEIAENYVNESWWSFADLSGVDLVMAGIGVAKIISKEKENRIEELEKACKETQELLDKQIEATYRLDKENAELKKDKKELCHSISEGGKACVYLNDQFTKAKELLKKLLSAYTTYADSFDDRDNEIVEEAEQFLNSEVEK